jgi:hypothetical protein
VVVSVVPPTSTTLVERNPDPDTVSVKALAPALAVVGLMDETARVGVVPLPPEPPDPPEPVEPEPPPHPGAKRDTPRPKATSRTLSIFIMAGIIRRQAYN